MSDPLGRNEDLGPEEIQAEDTKEQEGNARDTRDPLHCIVQGTAVFYGNLQLIHGL